MNAVAEIRDIKLYMRRTGEQARAAAGVLARADSATKDRALVAAAGAIRRDAARAACPICCMYCLMFFMTIPVLRGWRILAFRLR